MAARDPRQTYREGWRTQGCVHQDGLTLGLHLAAQSSCDSRIEQYLPDVLVTNTQVLTDLGAIMPGLCQCSNLGGGCVEISDDFVGGGRAAMFLP